MKRCENGIRSCAPYLQLVCLLMVGALECILFSIGNLHEFFFYDLLHQTIMIPCVLFWLVTCIQISGKRQKFGIGFAVAMVLWFLIVELQHRMHQMEPHTIGLMVSVYLLAFPFASVSGDSERQWGIKGMSLLFVGASMVLLLYTVLLLTGKLLGFLQGSIFWDGARLFLAMHPNTSSRVLMISIAFCLCATQYIKNKWFKIVAFLPVVPFFGMMALTNSRGTMVMTCAILAGTVFFAMYKGGWKRFAAGAVAAAIVFAGLFLTSKELFSWNGDRLIEKARAQQIVSQENIPQEKTQEKSETAEKEIKELSTEEAARQNLGGGSPQGSFLQDLWSLNSRTKIWGSLFEEIYNNPIMLLWGTDNTEKVTGTTAAQHTHNAWLETLARLGLPGFVLSLVFTVQAVWSAICLMWYPHVALEKKIISMLAIGLMVSGILEPFLFFTQDFAHYMDIVFFLCLGYMLQWKKQIKEDVV